MKNGIQIGCKKRCGFSSLFPWIFKVFSVWFSLRFSTLRFRIRAAVAKCGMPEYYGFYNGFWRFSSFTFFWKMAKNMKFRVEFRCKKRRKFSAEFPWKFDAKKHENLWKINENWHPKADLRKKRLRSEIFDGFGLLLWVRGDPKSPEVVRKGVQEGTQRTVKNTRVGNHRKSSWKGNVSI